MTGYEAAEDTVKRQLKFHVRSVTTSGDVGWLEHLSVDDDDKLVAHTCRPVHGQEIAMWKLLVELQLRVDDLETVRLG